MMKPLGWLAVLVLAAAVMGPPAAAQFVETPLADPALETRARAINKELRCLVCQNQSIDNSNSGMAADMRSIVR